MRAPVVLAALIGLTLVGCGSSAGQATATPSSGKASPSATTTIWPTPDWAITPSPTVSAASYKASAKTFAYRVLERDADSLAGTVVVFKGQVIQYDTATTRSHMRIDVTPDGYGGYNDTIWLDVDQAVTARIFRDSVIRFWGDVVGSYTYETVNNGHVTIPEVRARYVQILRS